MSARDIGARIGAALGRLVEAAGLGDLIRAAFAEAHGTCWRCERPLDGPAAERLCEECHADEAARVVWGGGEGGDA